MRKLAASLIFLLGCWAGMAPSQAQELKTVIWTYATPSAYYWDIFAAMELGFMAEEGVKVNAIRAESVAQQMQMLVTNAVNVVSANCELVITAVDRGAGLAIVGGETARQGYTLMARPEIRGYGDLRGKVVGVTQMQEASATMLQLLLKKNGLNPGDYQTVALGGTPNRYAALTKGAISATLLSPPADFKAEAQGMRKLGAAFEAFDGPQVVFTVQRAWAKANADTLVGFLRAAAKGMRWLYDPKNREAAADVLVKAIGGDREDALKTYDGYLGSDQIMARDLEITPAGIQAYLDLKGSKESPEKYLDLTYLKAALKR